MNLLNNMEEKQTEETVTTSSTVAPQQVVRTTKTVADPAGHAEHPQKVFNKKKTLFRTYQWIWYVLGVIEVLLALRVVLKALGANPSSGFAVLIYALSSPFAIPFSGLFGTTITANSVIEWSSMIAAAVYVLVAFGIIQLLQMAKPVDRHEVEQTVDEV